MSTKIEEKEQEQEHQVAIDCEASFPTAQLTCAMRALDASTTKCIGSNIGGGPDLAAAVFQGEVGPIFMKEYAAANGFSEATAAQGIVVRTNYFDQQWSNAQKNGCKQFVILAAGLDGRCWRLPGMDASHHVYEVDVKRAFDYKQGKLSQVAELCGVPACTRIAVEADLSQNDWPEKLIAAGFNPDLPSFFLMEGLTMFLPPEAPKTLLTATASLMSAGSVLSGDFMVNILDAMGIEVQQCLAKYGTKWTFEFTSRSDLDKSLTEWGFPEASLQSASEVQMQAQCQPEAKSDEVVDEEKARAFADKVNALPPALGHWPEQAQTWVATELSNGADEQFVAIVVADKTGGLGLKDESRALKARVVELVLGNGTFIPDLKAKCAELGVKGTGSARSEYMLFCASK
jgi:methyltransferase (TIGR00027 family)